MLYAVWRILVYSGRDGMGVCDENGKLAVSHNDRGWNIKIYLRTDGAAERTKQGQHNLPRRRQELYICSFLLELLLS